MYGSLPESSSDASVQISGYDWRRHSIPRDGTIRASEEISIDDGTSFVDEIMSYGFPKKWAVDRIGQQGYFLVIDGLESDTMSIDVYYDGRLFEGGTTPLRSYLKFRNRGFANYRDMLAKTLVYNVFEPLWQLRMILSGASFLHAASMSIDGRGVVLTGWGGSGKTSATSVLIRGSDDVEFLSDDLAIVTSEGEVYPYYKSSVIYAYNTAGDTLDESAFLEGVTDRLQWNWRKWRYGEKGVRRRVAPRDLFGRRVAPHEPHVLGTTVFLSREERIEFDHEPISPEELARRSTAVIVDELKWLVEYSSAVSGAGSEVVGLQDVIGSVENLYAACFEDVETVLLRIPMDASPDELADYLDSAVLAQ